jgi:hypothetical protein
MTITEIKERTAKVTDHLYPNYRRIYREYPLDELMTMLPKVEESSNFWGKSVTTDVLSEKTELGEHGERWERAWVHFYDSATNLRALRDEIYDRLPKRETIHDVEDYDS